MQSDAICIIPARGGSKRIPRKNLKPFCGQPIIAYSIKTALNSKLFDRVIVSTDDDVIAQLSKSFGAEVPFLRSKENATDYASTFDVIKEVLDKLKTERYTNCCCLYATAPFVTSDLLQQAKEKTHNLQLDCVFPITKFNYPIQRALFQESNKIRLAMPEHQFSRSQDLPQAYHDTGMFYWFNIDKILTAGTLWTENTGGLEVSELQCQDIDTIEDWKLAELKFQMIHETN